MLRLLRTNPRPRRNGRTASGMSEGADALAVNIKRAAMAARGGELYAAIGDLTSIAHDFGFMHARGDLSSDEVSGISEMLNEVLHRDIYPKIR